MSDMTSDRWLSLDEIANYLAENRYTTYKWSKRKNLFAYKIGSLSMFKRDEIDRWVRTGEAGESGSHSKQR